MAHAGYCHHNLSPIKSILHTRAQTVVFQPLSQNNCDPEQITDLLWGLGFAPVKRGSLYYMIPKCPSIAQLLGGSIIKCLRADTGTKPREFQNLAPPHYS